MSERYTVWYDEAVELTPEHYKAFDGLLSDGIPVEKIERRGGKIVGMVEGIWYIFGDLAEESDLR